MDFIIRVIFLVIGYFVGSIGLSQIFIILLFSKSFTKKLDKYGLLTNTQLIKKRENTTLKIWIVLYPLITFIVYWFTSLGSFIFYLTGSTLAIIQGFKFYRSTLANMVEYVQNNISLINTDKFDELEQQGAFVNDEDIKALLKFVEDEHKEHTS